MKRLWMGVRKRLRGAGELLAKIWAHRQGKVGLIMVTLLVLVAIFAPYIAPYNPYDVSQRTTKGLPPAGSIPWAPPSTPGRTFSACWCTAPGFP